MTTYTPQQKADALTLAQEVGATPAAQQLGIDGTTIRRWARTAHLALPNPRKGTIDVAPTVVMEAEARTNVARAGRIADAQAALPKVLERQLILVESHQSVSLRIVRRMIALLDRLDRADAALEQSIEGDRLEVARAEQSAAGRAFDVELERARKAAIEVGIHVDKLLRLAGEDGLAGPGGTTVNATLTDSPVTMMLVTDADFRRDVAASLRDRYLAINPGVDLDAVPA